MDKFYIEALQKIKSLPSIPSVKEWDKIAQKEGYMSSSTIVYISKKNFHRLCTEVRK